MAQAQLAALPPILPPSPGRPANASPEASPGMDGDAQAFARVLDRKVQTPRDTGDAPPANPRQEPARTADGASGTAPSNASDPADAPAEPSAAAPELTSTGHNDVPAGPDPLLTLTANPEGADAELVEPTPADPAANAPDPLQASLAGMPAALAALMTGGVTPAKPVAAGIVQGQGAVDAAGKTAVLSAVLSSTTPAPAPAAGEGNLALLEVAVSEGNDGAILTEAPGRATKPEVLPATETVFGPASRASEVAQLAANPEAGQGSGGRVEFDPASGLPVQAAPVAHSQRVDSTLHIHLPRPTDHPAWAESVASRVTWMVGQQESVAELVLTPPQLGRVEVTVSINGDQTTAQFVAATPAAREALEQALPRLREVLAEAGINLAESGVSTSDRHNPGDGPSRQGPGRLAAGGHLMNEVMPAERGWLQQGKGLVDTFA